MQSNLQVTLAAMTFCLVKSKEMQSLLVSEFKYASNSNSVLEYDLVVPSLYSRNAALGLDWKRN
jgi:hypothetical protein